MVERRITELHSSKLKITPAEQKPFDDFAQAMRDNASAVWTSLVSDHRAHGCQDRHGRGPAASSYSDMAQAHAEEVSAPA